MKTARTATWMLAGVLCCAGGRLRAASPAELVERGNRAYAAGKFDRALELYGRAEVDAPESDILYFNKGAAYFRKGDLAEARKMFEQAGLKTRDAGLEARSQYNLGNCEAKEAERRAENDPAGCVQRLRRAIEHYRHALRLDPGLEDAAHNLEVTRLRLKDLLDRLKRRREEQSKQRRNQEQNRQRRKRNRKNAGNGEQRKNKGGGDGKDGKCKEQPGAGSGKHGRGQERRDRPRPGGDARSRGGDDGGRTRREELPLARRDPSGCDARAILQEERENRRQRREAQGAAYVPVDKNW